MFSVRGFFAAQPFFTSNLHPAQIIATEILRKSSCGDVILWNHLAQNVLRKSCRIISRKTSFENPAEIILWKLPCGNLAEGLEYGLVMRHALLFVPADGSQHSLIIPGDDLFKIRQIVRV